MLESKYKLVKLIKRINILKQLGWYRSLSGKLVDPHCRSFITLRELVSMDDNQFNNLL